MFTIEVKRPKKSEMCPVGYHVVKGHSRTCHSGTKTWVDAHIRRNRGKRSLYLSENLLFLYWNNEKKYPKLKAIKGYPGHHNLDPIIQFWLNYWKKQGVKFPQGFTPLHVKAIIAAESGFRPKIRAKTSTATGLMQVLKSSIGPLKGRKNKKWREVRNQYVSIAFKELKDPVINIAVGIRWLGHKYFLLRNHKNIGIKEMIRDYHSRDKAGGEYAEKVLGHYNSSK